MRRRRRLGTITGSVHGDASVSRRDLDSRLADVFDDNSTTNKLAVVRLREEAEVSRIN